MSQALDTYPLTYCYRCEKETEHDGWQRSPDDNAVEIYCDNCGVKKGEIAYEDCPENLRQEIDELRRDIT